MAHYSWRAHRAEVSARGEFEFLCPGCGHHGTARVRVRGEGYGDSPYGLTDRAAARAAEERAHRAAGAMAQLASDLAACPECGYRENGKRYWVITLAIVLAVSLAAFVCLSCAGIDSTLLVCGSALPLAVLAWRAHRYRVATDPAVVTFDGYV